MSGREKTYFNTNHFYWIFYILLFLYLIPVWTSTYFPSQDGPVHLENARILILYGNSPYDLTSQFYELNTSQLSNWLIQLLLAALMSIFPILVAEKVVLSLYIIIFALTCLYLIRSIEPQNDFLAILLCFFFFARLAGYCFTCSE